MITDMKIMMEERLKLYQKHKRTLPRRIIVYRDGVSEGQFSIVVDEEYPRMIEAFKSFGNAKQPYRPQVTIVICGKRHHTRFYPADAQFADQNGNPRPGTVVDRGITAVYGECTFRKVFTDVKPTDNLHRFRFLPSSTLRSSGHSPSYTLLCRPRRNRVQGGPTSRSYPRCLLHVCSCDQSRLSRRPCLLR